MNSFNVVITTIGRPELYKMLISLENQLNKEDYLTIIIDHKEVSDFVFGLVLKLHFKCTVSIIVNSEKLGFNGHASISKYQNNLVGDFIIHADDDDTYTENAFDIIRKNVTDKETLYFFKMKDIHGNQYWNNQTIQNGIQIGNISKQNGVIPNIKILPDWGLFYEGDGQFYIDITKTLFANNYKFIDEVIYNYTRH